LVPDKPSYTIPARYWKDGYDALVRYDDDNIRRLTILELKRIQSFPDGYNFVGSKKDTIIQIGNAVACNFAYEMSIHLKKILDKNIKSVDDDIKSIGDDVDNDIKSVNNDVDGDDVDNDIKSIDNDVDVNDIDYNNLNVNELKKLCKERCIKNYSRLKRQQLILLLL
jgi:hypothetical protein